MADLQFRVLPGPLGPLVDKFYRAHRSPMRAREQDRVWVAQRHDILAALCLRPVASGHWLTGLFVAPQQRRQGLARHLVERALGEASGPTWLFCHPELEPFYRRLGFTPGPTLPAELHERLLRYRRHKPLLAVIRAGGPGADSSAAP